ncbi:zinc finger protein 638-like [Platichthys flesus]|uniref:zinc finger protein 638-like n=1 Tax=Platichthys flesus TaxID=8260 RepID=UPI002DB6EE88|nr:zinc finger protein 638-like [Platichthys flesus]
MLEEKKAPQQSSADTGPLIVSKTNDRTRNMAAGKTNNNIANNNNNSIDAARRNRIPNPGSVLWFPVVYFLVVIGLRKSFKRTETEKLDANHGSFALLLEHGAISPAPVPITSPRLGGFAGSSILIGQQAATLQLAHLRAQLALTQINNALTIGSQAANLTASSNVPTSYIPPTPPSPTAAAISLLNLLKIANTMSHPFYNPYVPGNQSSTQGSYGLPSVQAERNPRTGSPHFGPGSSSSAASSAPPGGMIPSLLTQSLSYRPEQGRAKFDTDIERSVDLHISRARDEVTFVGKPEHRPMGQSNRFTNTQEILSSGTGTTSYMMSTTSASAGHRYPDVESGGGSSDWLPCYTRSIADDSSTFSSPAASTNYTSSGGQRDAPAAPGLGDFDYRLSEKPGAPTETSRPKYNTEAATDILLQFGLEKKDLDYLISYPEEQMTPDNLPFILRQIRTQKDERAERAAIQPKPYPQPQPIRGVSGMDGFLGSGGSSAVLQPTTVIDYGHTGNYAGGALDEIGRPSGGSGNMLLVNTNNISSHNQEPPQKDPAVKSSSLGSSFGQGGAVSDSSYISILSTDPAKTQPNQSYQSILSSAYLSRKDKEGGFRHEASSKAGPLKKTPADHKSASKTQPSSSLFRSVHPNRPDLVVIGTSEASGTKNQSATQGKGSMVAKQMFKQQTQQQPLQMPKKQVPKQPVTHMGKALWPPVVSATQPASLLALPTYPDRTVPPPGFSPHPTSTPSASLQQARGPKTFLQSPTEHQAKLPDTNPLPTPAMMHDYAAATPRVFPHTCSLCLKEFTNMKDWISHQNTSLHLESCRVLRTKYPLWNGEVLLEPSAARRDAKPSSSASAQTSHLRHTKTSHGGRSRSHSEGRREKRSRSLSSHSPRYSRSRSRSRSPRYDHDWSCSRSLETQRRREGGWSSPTRSLERRSPMPRRSEERWLSPRRSRERLSSPGRRGDRWPSPEWSEERWSSPRRSRERLSSPRRGEERWLSPKRRDDLWYSRRPSSSEGSPQRRLSSAGRLSKKQTDVQSLTSLPPALLNELGKKAKGGKRLNLIPSAVRKSPGSAASLAAKKKTMVTTSLQKSDVSASPKPKVFKPAPPTMVRLEGVVSGLSHSDVVAAAEQFGKTKSVVLFRKKLEALVCFEKEEDAKKLKSLKSLDLRGIPVYVATQKILQQKKNPVKKPVLSGVSTSQTTKTTKTTTSSRTVLLPTSSKAPQNSSGAKTKEKQQAPASASKAVGSDSASSQELLTIGDTIIKQLNQNKIKCVGKKICQQKQFLESDKRHLVISQLPKYEDGCYTEEDIANVLLPYGFIYKREKIFVFPEACMAFVVMPTVKDAHEIMKLMVWNSIMFKGSRLLPHVLHDNVLKSPLTFYTYVMSLFLTQSEEDRGERIIYIEDISPSEARGLREVLRKIGCVTNFMPLLNKVFVEFDSSCDADRIGVWHSLLNDAPGYKVFRLKPTDEHSEALSPRLPANALPDSKDVVPGATIPTVKFGVPQGSIGPFWLTMATSPFLFPTVSPWFIIPEHLTITGEVDIEKVNSQGSMFPTLMLTGLPEGDYSQEDVARLVLPYFPKQTLDSLYYNVVVLTLQRRAFVHFSDWSSCCDFVRYHIREPVSVQGCVLKIHFVLEYMYPESREELMYKSMMKWSNSRVPDPQSLEERLLCVVVSKTSVHIIKTVMYTLASIAKFVSFLPLANRICVEMADSTGAAQVLEKYMFLTPKAQCERLMFQKVTGIRSLKSSKKHVEASAEPAGDVPMEDVEKLGAEMAADAPKADEDVNAADGDTVAAASCPTFSATSLPKSKETTTEHPPIDQDAITAVLAAVRQHRLAQERTQRGETESSLRSQSQDEVTDVVLTSDDQPLNLRDFVTVDEVGDDVEETNPAHEASRSQRDAKKRKPSNKPIKATEQETSEILISDNQTIMDQNTESQSDQMSTDISSREEEEDSSKVVDSVSDQPTTTESESDNKKPDATSRRDDRSSKRSGLRTRASKSEEKVKSTEKQDRVVKRSEAPQDSTARLPQRDQDPEEEKVSEMVHSTEELIQEAAATERTDRRRSGRGKKEEKMTLNLTEASEKPDEEEEASYEILDSVEDETVTEEPVVMTRSTRGRRGRTTQKDQTKKEDTPTRSRRTPVRESQEKTPKMEKEESSKENSPTKKKDITVREEIDEEATYEILDSVKDEVLQEDRPPTGGKRKRGRPKKAVKSTRKKPVTLKGDKEADDEEADDEKVPSMILDSVEDEMVEDQPPTEESLKVKEEEPVHQIVDFLEDDQVQEELMTTEESKDETFPKEEKATVQEDASTCRIIVLEASEKVVAEDLESGNDPSAAEESGVDKKERSLRTDIKEEDTSTTKSQGDAATPAEDKNQQSSSESDSIAVKSALLNLDEVRDEKDDYPEDAAEEEGLRERQAAAKEQERNTRETDGREQEVVDSTELVTLDEVGADEAGEEAVELRAGDLQGLVTLDEIIDADKGEVEKSTLEPRPPIKEDHAVETLDEAGDDEEGNTDEAEKTTRSVKRRINDDTEEGKTLVKVDEVEEEEKKEAPRTRGRPKKRSRKTPVRKSARGKKVVEQAESGSDAPPPTSLDASSSLDKDQSMLSSDSQQEIQKASIEGAGHSDIDAASAGQDLQPEAPENQRLEGEEAIEASSGPSKRKREPVGPEAKRSRSLSPSVSTDIKLPPFSPSNPLGPEFLVPKLGYFCNLCHVFCVHESSARDTHCSSQTHYDNLQKHYEKLQPEPSKGSTENSQASSSD